VLVIFLDDWHQSSEGGLFLWSNLQGWSFLLEVDFKKTLFASSFLIQFKKGLEPFIPNGY